jgi:hypothetical protein
MGKSIEHNCKNHGKHTIDQTKQINQNKERPECKICQLREGKRKHIKYQKLTKNCKIQNKV